MTHVERGNRWSDFYAPERQGSHPPFVLIILHNRCDMTWRMWPEISATRRKDKVSSQHGLFNSFASILKWLIRCAKCWHAMFYSSEVVRVSSKRHCRWMEQVKKIVLPGRLRQQRFIWYMREQFNFVIILFYDIWNAVQLDSSNLQIHQPFFSNFSSNLRRRHGKLTVILCKTTTVWYTYFFLKYFSFQVNYVGRRACTYS